MATEKKPDTTMPPVEQKPVETVTEYVVKDQEKFDTFRRLASKRLSNALDKIELIGNCANRAQYEYSPAQIAKIKQALETKIAFVLNKFEPGKKACGNQYEL